MERSCHTTRHSLMILVRLKKRNFAFSMVTRPARPRFIVVPMALAAVKELQIRAQPGQLQLVGRMEMQFAVAEHARTGAREGIAVNASS